MPSKHNIHPYACREILSAADSEPLSEEYNTRGMLLWENNSCWGDVLPLWNGVFNYNSMSCSVIDITNKVILIKYNLLMNDASCCLTIYSYNYCYGISVRQTG